VSLWRVRDPSSLHWRQWDDGLVVYHAPSGDTHLLDPTAGAALSLLRAEPSDLAGLVRRVTAQGGAAPGFEESLAGLLKELEELGVVECA